MLVRDIIYLGKQVSRTRTRSRSRSRSLSQFVDHREHHRGCHGKTDRLAHLAGLEYRAPLGNKDCDQIAKLVSSSGPQLTTVHSGGEVLDTPLWLYVKCIHSQSSNQILQDTFLLAAPLFASSCFSCGHVITSLRPEHNSSLVSWRNSVEDPVL